MSMTLCFFHLRSIPGSILILAISIQIPTTSSEMWVQYRN
jgi:hypothetical protein